MVLKRIKEKIKEKGKKEIVIASLSVGILFGLVFGYVLIGYLLMNSWNLPFISLSKAKVGIEMSTADLSNKAEEYLNVNFLKAYGATANVTKVTNYGNINALEVNIMQNGSVVSAGEVYITNDGEFLLIGQLYNMSQKIEQPAQTQPSQQTQQIQKTERPSVKLFVMSYCPYGQQAETAMWPVLDLLGDKINFELHYVIYPAQYYRGYEDQYCINKTYCSMHGVGELNEDIRQMCIKENYDYSVWSTYIKSVSTSCNYQNVDSCWEGVAKQNGIDTELIKSCYNENAIKYAEEEMKLNEQYGVQGSPTLFINDVEYSGGRTPEAYKSTICSAFLQAPDKCSTALSNQGATTSGNCG